MIKTFVVAIEQGLGKTSNFESIVAKYAKLKTQVFWTTNIRKAALFKHKADAFESIVYANNHVKNLCIDGMLNGYYIRFMDSRHRNHYLGFK